MAAAATPPPNNTTELTVPAMFPDMASTVMSAATAPLINPPPFSVDDIASARRLVADGIWGVVSSFDYETASPFGNVLSYADGGTGTPYFFLTRLDGKTAKLADLNPKASLAISQYGVDQCPDLDPQEPLCSRVTLTGRLLRLNPGSSEGIFAGAALLKRHPRYNRLPAAAKFELFKLELTEDVFLINSYIGSPKMLPLPAYLNFTSSF